MNFKFEFDAPVLSLIFKALSKLPFEESASLIQGLQREVAAQEMKAKGTEINSGETMPDAKKKPGRPPKASGAAEQPQAQ